jgi:putative ABC transport system substrate-binding protein
MIRRREFLTVLSGAVAWPLAARAQQGTKLPTIGLLGADAVAWAPWTAAFVQRLAALGWVENRNIAIEYRWSEGRPERYAEIGAEFVRLKVDIIVTNNGPVPALRQATSVIPIVFVLGIDPIGGGLITSIARPGGNVTGLSTQTADLAGKKIEFLNELVPHMRRFAIMADAGYPEAMLEMAAAQTAARALGLAVKPLEIRGTQDIGPAFATLKDQVDALYVVGAALIAANRTRIITMTLGARLPTMFNTRAFVEAGGLMSYGSDFADQFRRAADFVDKILRGTKPSDIPVEQPTKFELVINLTTAKALGVTVPQLLLYSAEVIE